jgi:DNA primase
MGTSTLLSNSMLDIFSYLESKGVQIIRDDGSELACYCPFHNNLDTPAFYVNKKTGLWICFNPSCGKTGSVRDLMEFFGDHGKFVRDYSIDEIDLNLSFIDKENKEDHSWELVLEEIAVHLPEESYKLQYLLDRSFTIETLEHFGVAFSQAKKRIVIPARDERHLVVGFIGRTIDPEVQPKYLYSKGFPRKDILFNLNNAKRYDSCIVVEGSLDAMKIHQAGFPNVVASLGASITKQHIEKLNKYFDKIIIFSDNDIAGFSMRDIIINGLYHKDLKIVQFEDPDIKDPGDMNDEQIASHINNSIDFFTWSFDNVLSY